MACNGVCLGSGLGALEQACVHKCCAKFGAPNTLLGSAMIVGVFDPRLKKSLRLVLGLKRRLHCLKLVMLLSPSGTAFLPKSELALAGGAGPCPLPLRQVRTTLLDVASRLLQTNDSF